MRVGSFTIYVFLPSFFLQRCPQHQAWVNCGTRFIYVFCKILNKFIWKKKMPRFTFHQSVLECFTWIDARKSARSVVFSSCCAQFCIIASVSDGHQFGAIWHNTPFQISSCRAVVGADDQCCLALSDQTLLVAQLLSPAAAASWWIPAT